LLQKVSSIPPQAVAFLRAVTPGAEKCDIPKFRYLRSSPKKKVLSILGFNFVLFVVSDVANAAVTPLKIGVSPRFPPQFQKFSGVLQKRKKGLHQELFLAKFFPNQVSPGAPSFPSVATVCRNFTLLSGYFQTLTRCHPGRSATPLTTSQIF